MQIQLIQLPARHQLLGLADNSLRADGADDAGDHGIIYLSYSFTKKKFRFTSPRLPRTSRPSFRGLLLSHYHANATLGSAVLHGRARLQGHGELP